MVQPHTTPKVPPNIAKRRRHRVSRVRAGPSPTFRSSHRSNAPVAKRHRYGSDRAPREFSVEERRAELGFHLGLLPRAPTAPESKGVLHPPERMGSFSGRSPRGRALLLASEHLPRFIDGASNSPSRPVGPTTSPMYGLWLRPRTNPQTALPLSASARSIESLRARDSSRSGRPPHRDLSDRRGARPERTPSFRD